MNDFIFETILCVLAPIVDVENLGDARTSRSHVENLRLDREIEGGRRERERERETKEFPSIVYVAKKFLLIPAQFV